MKEIQKISANTHIGDYGQIVDSFVITVAGVAESELKKIKPDDFSSKK